MTNSNRWRPISVKFWKVLETLANLRHKMIVANDGPSDEIQGFGSEP